MEKEMEKENDYSKGKVYFEGEYLNGVRNGKGKEYDYKGRLIYEEDGNKIEKGKEINFENNSIFEGDFSNGEK